MPNNTATLVPADGATVYKGQVLELVFTVSSDTANTIQASDTASFNLGDQIAPLDPNANLNPNLKVTDNGKTGVASLMVYVLDSATAPSISANTSVAGVGDTYSDLVIDTIQIVSITGPAPGFLPTNTSSNGTPADTDHTAILTVKILDSKSQPVQGYLIHWLQNLDGALFTRTNPFDGTDTALQVLPDAFHGTAQMVRSATNALGVATLKLVSKSGVFSRAFNTVWMAPTRYEITPIGSIMIADLSTVALPASPTPDGLVGNYLDYDSIPGPDVGVMCNYRNADPSDQVYVIINKIMADSFRYGDRSGQTYNGKFAKIYGYSDTGLNANQPNHLQFVVGTSLGESSASLVAAFRGKGNTNVNDPPDVHRVLDEPSLPDIGTIINWQVAQVDITVRVPLKQANWPNPQPTDKVLVKMYLNGWDQYGNPKSGQAPQAEAGPTLTGDDITNGYVDYPLPHDLFQNFYKDPYAPYQEGKFQCTYSIASATDPNNPAYSAVLSGILDTTPPGR